MVVRGLELRDIISAVIIAGYAADCDITELQSAGNVSVELWDESGDSDETRQDAKRRVGMRRDGAERDETVPLIATTTSLSSCPCPYHVR